MEQKSLDKDIQQGLFKGTPIYIGVSIILLVALVFSILISVAMGSVDISFKDIYRIIFYKTFSIGNPDTLPSDAIIDIVWFIRLPRIILATCVGMGLSISGLIMQAVVKNPLADPYILGVSSGAYLGTTLAIMLGVGISLGSNYVGICAFIGAFAISILVITMANINGRANSTKLLLSGMALSTLCSAFSSFIVYFCKNKEKIRSITYWLMGSLAGAKWESIKFIFPIIIISTIFFITQYRTLNLMLLGDEVSITLGKDLHTYRQVYLLVTSLIIGLIVYSSGIIGFVGLIIPHIVRILFGTDHKKIIPITALIGSIFLIWADVLSRIIIPGSELPIGILISMIGTPIFIYLMINKSYGFGGGR
ncbi:FecCD family ABC transporter permease [Anaerosalibacter sp. Marseille-P3206]|uniref:FecCD family ABC transporter permease n=1 Tax=Anaerosalibacter sp. Marseille-P3206 TaxID=1871005 RepID=UPI00190E8445|nr:iron ABC transporter permease [Anaerosalibacter sp. Marseille-P3206]